MYSMHLRNPPASLLYINVIDLVCNTIPNRWVGGKKKQNICLIYTLGSLQVDFIEDIMIGRKGNV
jgi:hypothetical protein